LELLKNAGILVVQRSYLFKKVVEKSCEFERVR